MRTKILFTRALLCASPFGADNTLYYPNAAMTIGYQRSYFKPNHGLKAGEVAKSRIVLNFGDGARAQACKDKKDVIK